jgi:PKD repeat protein
VTRLGINLWGTSQWDDSLTALKNLVPDPGFEPAVFRSNILLRADGSNSTAMMQDNWQLSWNNDSQGIGQPAGFWDGAQYEFVYGAAKGINGTVTRFAYAPDGQGIQRPVFVLDRSVPLPSNSDVMTVRKKFDSNYLRSINATASQWDIQGDGNVFFDKTDNRPGTPGEQSLRIGNDTRIVLSMDTFYRDGDVTCGKSIIVKGDWKVSFWAKGEYGNEKVRVQFFREFLTPLFCQTTLTLSPGWFRYELDFSVPYGLDEDRDYNASEPRGILNFNFDTTGQGNAGRIWLDDVHLGKRGQANPTVLSDNALRLLKEFNPGILRGWYGQLGISLEEFTDPAEGRCIAGFRIGGRNAVPISYSANEFLQIAQELNASAWLVIPPTFSSQEYRDLIDFLAGPTSTLYGAKRAALGRTEPWTDAFGTIFLEWGNELWGNGTDKEFFGGASVNGGVRLGSIANQSFAIIRSSISFDPERIKLVIGGHNEDDIVQAQIAQNSVNHDVTGIAPYFYGALPDYSSEEDIYGPLYAIPTEQASSGHVKRSVDNITSTGNGASPAIYEMNFHTTWPPGAPEEVRNDLVTGIGGGIALSHSMLTYLLTLGITDQCAFCSWLYSYEYSTAPSHFVRLFGLLRDLDRTGHKRPTWLGIEIVNKAMAKDLVTTEQSGDNPSWLQRPLNGLSQSMNVPYIKSFAFRDGKNRSIVLYNLHRTDYLNASLILPAIPQNDAVKYLLSAPNLNDSNEKNELVKITSVNLTDFVDGYRLSLPPHSITVLKWVGNLRPEGNFTFSPADPLALSPVDFNDTSIDPDGSVVNWSWSFGDGSPPERTRNSTHSFPDDGNFTVNLTVRDNEGASSLFSRTISVGNIPPVCHVASGINTIEDAEVFLTGTADDTPSDRPTLIYRWDLGDGAADNWSASPSTNHTYRQKGNYTATLTVQDDGGLEASASLNISVQNIPPTAVITGPPERDFIEDQLINFTGEGNDTSSDIPLLRFRWDLGDGNSTDLSSSPAVSHAYPRNGTYDTVFWVKDDDNETANATTTIRVRNVPPTGDLNMSADTVSEDEEVHLMAVNISDTPSDLPNLNLTWSVGGIFLGYGMQQSILPSIAGILEIRLVITDDDGANHSNSKNLTVIDPPPRASFTTSSSFIDVNDAVQFNASASWDTPSDLATLNFSWDFGDGHGGSGKTVSHTYYSSGNFTVNLTVRDDEGAQNATWAAIFVKSIYLPRPRPPQNTETGINAVSLYLTILLVVAAAAAMALLWRRKGQSLS